MKTFIFTRTISVEERYRVTMSDDMANPTVARNILHRQLSKEQLTSAVELVDSRVINTGRSGRREEILGFDVTRAKKRFL